LLTTAARHVFAQLHGTLDGADQQRITLAPDDFTLSGGKALLGFLAQPAPGSSLDPATVLIHDTSGAPMQPLVARHNIAGSIDSLVLAELPLGTFDVTVTQQSMTSGDYEIDVFLVGDMDGDRSVTLADGAAIRAIFGATAGDGRYEVEADADRNGQITSLDYTYWRRNLDDATTLALLTLDVMISPLDEQPNGSLTTTAAAVDVTGSTLAGQPVVLDVNGATSNTNAALDGSFSFQTELALGLNQLVVSVADTFGQHREHSVEVTRIPSDSEPPVIAVGLHNDTGESAADFLTFDPAITGSVSDESEISAFGIAIGSHTAVPPPSYVSALRNLQVDGTFLLDRFGLESLLGPQLSDGDVTLALMATDGAGNTSFVDVSFTLDATAPAPPQLDLSISSDSGVVGDQQTTYASVTLAGAAESGVRLELLPIATQTLASTQGKYFLPQVDLALGVNPLTLRAIDAAGNSSQTARTFTRLAPDGQTDPVLFWNQVALEAIRMDADTPPEASRMLAILHAAVLDAVNAIDGTPAQYVALPAQPVSSPAAAVSAAAHAVLSYVYPAQQAAFDAALNNALSEVPAGEARTNGLALGQAVADALLRLREEDGYDAFVESYGGQLPGQWRPTAFMFDVPLLPQWGDVQPFVVSRDDVALPAGPPELTSQQWVDAFNEVKGLGDVRSTTRTAEQTNIARFWADGLGTYTPSGHWNQIAGVVAQSQAASLADNARLFAQLNLGLADAAILTWYVKYETDFWRPITAIPQADSDGNDQTVADPNWVPLLPTPPFPEYVSGHSTYSGAAAGILSALLGDDVPFTVGSFTPANLVRSFPSFDAAAAEAAYSRLLGGIHYRFSNEEGLALGQQIADAVLGAFSASHDARPPAILLDKPPAVSAQNITLHGQILDNLTGLAEATVQMDDGPAQPLTLDAWGRFTLPANFLTDGTDDGPHLFLFRALDAAGNESTRELTLTLDTQAPAITVTSPVGNGVLNVTSRVTGVADPIGTALTTLRYAFDGGESVPIFFDPVTGSFDDALDLSRLAPGVHAVTVSARDAAGNESLATLHVSLAGRVPFTLGEVMPTPGSDDVGSTFRPQVRFSRAVNSATLNADNFYATDTTGEKLPATIVPANDGSFAWLFFQSPMAGASMITVHVVGDTILAAADGVALDADGDGTAGGSFTYQFATVSLAPLPGTSLSGKVVDPGPDLKPMSFDDMRPGPDGMIHTADDLFLNPIAHAKVFILGLEDQFVFTDAQGYFVLESVPSGNVKLAIDGRTATNAPPGIYWPEMVMDLEVEVGRANTVMGTMGTREEKAANRDRLEAYLPRLRTDILQAVSGPATTVVGVNPASAPNLTDQQRALLQIAVPPGSLIAENGQPLAAGQVGISTVPPELVRDMLPPGLLQHTFDITIQAPGISNFSTPAPMTFPNLFDAAPGSKLNFLSFDHTTGRLVIEGTATVSADGLRVTTDPGTGITHPGWHGMTPPGSQVQQLPPKEPPCEGWNSDDTWALASALVQALKQMTNFGGIVKTGLDAVSAVASLRQSLVQLQQDWQAGELSRQGVVAGLEALNATKNFAKSAYENFTSKNPLTQLGNTIAAAVNLANTALDRVASRGPECLGVGGSIIVNIAREIASLASSLLSNATDLERSLRNVPLTAVCLLFDGLLRQVSNIPSSGVVATQQTDLSDTELLNAIQGIVVASEDFIVGNQPAMSAVSESITGAGGELTELEGLTSGLILGNGAIDEGHWRAISGLAELRGRTNSLGVIAPMPFLPASSNYRFEIYHHAHLVVLTSIGSTAPSGSLTELMTFSLSPSDGEPDADNDGLSDLAEAIVGTSLSNPDTDGDGIFDEAEITQGLDPLDNRAFPTGVIAALPLAEQAKEVVAEGSITSAETQTAYVATGTYGLAIVNASQFQRPIVLGQLDLPGDATDLAVDSRLQIAVVATNAGGLQFVDVADSTRPMLLQTINVNASQVEVVDGVACAAVGGAVRTFDVLTGEPFETLSLGGASIVSLAREGAMLYTLDSNRVLRAIDIGGFTMAARGSLTLNASSGKLFVGNGIAYIGGGVDTAGGFSTVDVSNPGNLILLSGVDALNIEGRAVVANGSGLAVSVGNVRGPVGQQFLGLDVLDVSVPTDTSRFLTRIVLPSVPSSVAIAAGIAFVANGTSGLQVVNYVPFDNQGQTPTVSIRAAESVDLDPNMDGIQVVEGSSIPIVADISDDVQVRNVELLVNGQVVRNDVSFPFDFSAIALPLAPDNPTTLIQVRATDTGGNVAVSSELSIDLVPDQFAPTVLSVNPANNTARPPGLQAVTIRFSEPIAAASASPTTFQVFGAGPNGQLGDADDIQVDLVDVRLRYDDEFVQLTASEPLPIGLYELRIAEANVLDRAGNALGSGTFRSQFEVVSTDFTVNSLADTVDAQPGDGRAADATGATTLRAAIMEANSLGEGTITLPPGTYSLAIPGRNEDGAATGDLDINGRITLLGSGAKVTIINANGLDRVFHVLPGSEFDLSGVTVTGGNASGAINVSASGGGGLLNVLGHLTIDASTISNNTAAAVGGGISNLSGTLLVTRSTISGNSAPINSGDGGALYMDGSNAQATIINSTFSGNSAQDLGAGIRNYNGAKLSLLNSTFANHIGRAIHTDVGAITSAKNTLISGSVSSATGGQFVNLGNNLISSSISGLGPLQDNGGPTLTHALLPGSPAIDAADNSSAPETDQRGVLRPQDGNGDGVARADIGAFEFEATVQPLLSAVGARSSSLDVAEVSSAELALTFEIATGIWAAGEGSSPLRGVALRIADLPGSYLGFATHDTIWIDADAAGHGWYVGVDSPDVVEDQTRFDLLTVVLHELGHVLGYDDLDSESHADELMSATLTPGQRRLPHQQSDQWKEPLDQLFAEWDE